MLVHKLGVPSHPECAMGTIAGGGILIRNEDILQAHPIDQDSFDTLVARETRELQCRERFYRSSCANLCLEGQVVILIDDGLVTGTSMMSAIHAVRVQSPSRILVAH